MNEPLVRPFKGLLYNRRTIGDISRCVCPPYDIIPDPKIYYERSPFNAIRLEVPVATSATSEYDAAAGTLAAWVSDHVLEVDERETAYLYEQEFVLDGITHTRRGFIPLVKLSPDSILTHEQTRKAAREDREKLIRRLKTFTSLVFALYEDREKEIERLIASADKELIYSFTDELSIQNRFYRVRGERDLGEFTALMEGKKLYIADGHHRLSVAYKLGLSYVAMYLTDMHSEGIVILPYHRVVRSESGYRLSSLLDAVKGIFRVKQVALTGPETLTSALRDLSGTNPSFALFSKEDTAHLYVLSQEKPFFRDVAVPETLRKLNVNIAHSGVLKGLFGVKEEEISFPHDAAEASGLVLSGAYDFALFVPSTTVEEVRDVADHALYMPPKSTYFFPKILTGLVFYSYA